jgi:hypothetical protein
MPVNQRLEIVILGIETTRPKGSMGWLLALSLPT